MDYRRSIVRLATALTHGTPWSTRALHFFKRRKPSLRLRRLCEQDHREMMDEVTAVNETRGTTSSEHQVKTVIALLDASLPAASSAAELIACMTASMHPSLNELSARPFALRNQASRLQSTHDGKRPSTAGRGTRHSMPRLTRRAIPSSQNQALRMRMNQMRKLLPCLRRSSVRSLDLIGSQTLVSPRI